MTLDIDGNFSVAPTEKSIRPENPMRELWDDVSAPNQQKRICNMGLPNP